MKLENFFLAACLTLSCSARQEPETHVLRYTWVWCWQKCGRGDNLAAVSSSACICLNGDIIPLQPKVYEKPQPSFFDRLLAFLKGE